MLEETTDAHAFFYSVPLAKQDIVTWTYISLFQSKRCYGKASVFNYRIQYNFKFHSTYDISVAYAVLLEEFFSTTSVHTSPHLTPPHTAKNDRASLLKIYIA